MRMVIAPILAAKADDRFAVQHRLTRNRRGLRWLGFLQKTFIASTGDFDHYLIAVMTKIDQFPLTVSGKVQKFVIRERMIRELNLSLDAYP